MNVNLYWENHPDMKLLTAHLRRWLGFARSRGNALRKNLRSPAWHLGRLPRGTSRGEAAEHATHGRFLAQLGL